MKRKFYLFAALSAMVLSSCTKDPNELGGSQMPNDSRVLAIQIDGAINQQYTTRVDDGGFCQDDQVGLFGVNYTDKNTVKGTLVDEGNQVDNARYTYDESQNKWVSPGGVFYKDAKTNIDLYAYYPYAAVNSVSEYPFEVQQDQSGANSMDGYALSDFLWGKVENVTPSEAKVRIKFDHRMACANVVLVEGEGFGDGEFDALDKSVLAMNTTRTATIDLATGEVSATGTFTGEGIVMKHNAEGYRAIVVPQIVESGAALFSITIDGVVYRFKYKDDDDNLNAFAYESGSQAKFTIEINKKSPSGDYELSLEDCEIVPWIADLDTHGGEARQYYCVHLEQAGTLGAKIRADKKNPDKIKNLKISGIIDGCEFFYMRDSMEILQSVNLKECKIIASTKASRYRSGYSNYIGDKDNDEIFSENYYGSGYTYGNIEDAIPACAFRDKETLVNFVFPEKVVKIGAYAFYKTMLLGALIIPSDVECVENHAFYATSITSLQLPTGLKSLGQDVFHDCNLLTGQLMLPEGLESIGSGCFYGCVGLTANSLVLPEKLTEIPDHCFYGCKGLTGKLVLHEGVTKIGEYAFRDCKFNGSLELPNSLKEIGRSAFYGIPFTGELVIPNQITRINKEAFFRNRFNNIILHDDIVRIDQCGFEGTSGWNAEPNPLTKLILPASLRSIGNSAFQYQKSLEYLHLPTDLEVIEELAFYNSPNLKTVICEAIIPPTLVENTGYAVFASEAYENATLYVPAQSIVKYQVATGWKNFKNIQPYYAFNVDNNMVRSENASTEHTIQLSAFDNDAWTMVSSPDWVEVTPTSGTGATTLTLTLKELAAGSGDRTGVVTFKLDNEETALASITAEQYDIVDAQGEVVADGDVITNYEHTEGNGVKVVFLGEGYDASDVDNGKYTNDINTAIGHMFDVEPFKTYKGWFDVYTVVAISKQAGVSSEHNHKTTTFGIQYIPGKGLKIKEQVVFKYAQNAGISKEDIKKSLIVIVVNSDEYEGITYMWEDGSNIAICPTRNGDYPYDFRGTIQHEACGHAFAKLGDENISQSANINSNSSKNKKHKQNFKDHEKLGWNKNIALSGNMSEVAWKHFMVHPKYKDQVDIFEGGYGYSHGIYRSEDVSCMGTYIPYFSAISRETIVKRIMECGGGVFDQEQFYQKDVRDVNGSLTGGAATRSNFVEKAVEHYEPVVMGVAPELNF